MIRRFRHRTYAYRNVVWTFSCGFVSVKSKCSNNQHGMCWIQRRKRIYLSRAPFFQVEMYNFLPWITQHFGYVRRHVLRFDFGIESLQLLSFHNISAKTSIFRLFVTDFISLVFFSLSPSSSLAMMLPSKLRPFSIIAVDWLSVVHFIKCQFSSFGVRCAHLRHHSVCIVNLSIA